MSEDIVDITPKENKESEKTPEQLAQEEKEAREARYKASPDTFIEISELVIAVVKTPGVGLGMGVFIAPAKRSEYDIAWSEINLRLLGMLMTMDRDQALRDKPAIIDPRKPRIRDIFPRRH